MKISLAEREEFLATSGRRERKREREFAGDLSYLLLSTRAHGIYVRARFAPVTVGSFFTSESRDVKCIKCSRDIILEIFYDGYSMNFFFQMG